MKNVSQHPTAPDLWVAYNDDGSQAAHLKLAICDDVPPEGAVVPLELVVVWRAEGDYSSRPVARLAPANAPQ